MSTRVEKHYQVRPGPDGFWELRFFDPRATRRAVEAMRRAGFRIVVDEGGRYRVVDD
jgi:hypothetical protein